MAFTVEDGTGLDDANSYASVVEFKAYHDERGNSYAGIIDATIQKLLVKATDYIDRRWGSLFLGSPLTSEQALAFPRDGLYDARGVEIEGVPTKLKYACAEYALYLNTGSLYIEESSSGQVVSRTRTVIGPIEEDITYSVGGVVSTTLGYPVADKLLSGFILSGSTVIRA